MQHFISLDSELSCYSFYNVTPNEMLLIRVLMLASSNDPEEKKYIQQYFQLPECCRGSIFEMLNTLQAKGIIKKSYKIPERGQAFDPSKVEFNQATIKGLYKASYDLGKELWEAYPLSTVVNGTEYKLKRISNKFDTIEDAFRYYGQAIRWNIEKHKEIINLVKWGVTNGYSFTTLGAFLADHDWNNIEAMKSGSVLTSSAMELV